MRFPQVRVAVVDRHGEREYAFEETTLFTVGRDRTCQLQLSGLGANSQVSRLHCQLDIDPPFAKVSDLGSTNGTYVNGRSIPPNVHPDDTLGDPPWSRDLKDGDEIRVGEVLLRVAILHEEYAELVDSSADFECAEQALEPAPVLHALTA